jgi:DNA replicative helicase MCM subunit Mcm2 (Cdc46/Mcm family)
MVPAPSLPKKENKITWGGKMDINKVFESIQEKTKLRNMLDVEIEKEYDKLYETVKEEYESVKEEPIKEIISELENKFGKCIPIADIIKEAAGHGIEKEVVEEAIEKLKRSGDMFEPKHGLIQRL